MKSRLSVAENRASPEKVSRRDCRSNGVAIGLKTDPAASWPAFAGTATAFPA